MRLVVPSQIDLAWQVLRITALALPALAIFLEVQHQLLKDTSDPRAAGYRTSMAAILLLLPMALVGIIAAGVVFFSYQILWLQVVAMLMAVAFLSVPLFIYAVHSSISVQFKEGYLEEEKQFVIDAAKSGDISKTAANRSLELVKMHRNGFRGWLRYRERYPIFRNHPIISNAIQFTSLFIAVYLLFQIDDYLELEMGVVTRIITGIAMVIIAMYVLLEALYAISVVILVVLNYIIDTYDLE